MDRWGRIRSVCTHHYPELAGSEHADSCVSNNMELCYQKIFISDQLSSYKWKWYEKKHRLSSRNLHLKWVFLFSTTVFSSCLKSVVSVTRGACNLEHRFWDSTACSGITGSVGDTCSVRPGRGRGLSNRPLWTDLEGSAKTRKHIHCCSD